MDIKIIVTIYQEFRKSYSLLFCNIHTDCPKIAAQKRLILSSNARTGNKVIPVKAKQHLTHIKHDIADHTIKLAWLKKMLRSMSNTGTPTDNVIIEALNAWIKEELYLDFSLETAEDVPTLLDEYVYYFK